MVPLVGADFFKNGGIEMVKAEWILFYRRYRNAMKWTRFMLGDFVVELPDVVEYLRSKGGRGHDAG